jgi:proteic killer suppression protein
MNVLFEQPELDRLETDGTFSMGLPPAVVKQYRKRLQFIRAAVDTRDLRAMSSWRLEKLKGKRQHQHSLRLNDQFRLVVEIQSDPNTGSQQVLIVAVEDYH